MNSSSDRGVLFRFGRWFHRRYLRGRVLSDPLHILRCRLIFLVWGYWPLLFLRNTSLRGRLELLIEFLKIDWHVVHAHRPAEMSTICREVFAQGPAGQGEVFVEAGCWQGGSSAKFSILCERLGYQLHIYDSFEGVERMRAEDLVETVDYSGLFSAPENLVVRNLENYGKAKVCHLHRGWFADTLAVGPVPWPVRFAYLDCDLAKGTEEALKGIVPSLATQGIIFSQDYHIKPVRVLLHDPQTWKRLGSSIPRIAFETDHLASITFG